MDKIAFDDGAPGYTTPVSHANPLPVVLSESNGPLAASASQSVTQAVDGAFAIKALPSGVATSFAPQNATSTAYEASRVVKQSGGVVYGMSGYNSKASAQFIQFFDAAALPADAAVPVGSPITVGASSNFSIDFGVYGRKFLSGIVVCNSSTGPTKTIGSADCFFDVRYV